MVEKGRYPVPRAHQRFAVDMDARVSTDLGRYRARTHDLSRGGISLYLPFPLDVGASFTVELALIFGENAQSEPLVLSARVVWCTHHGEGYQVGASFLSMDAQTQQYLRMFLNFLSEGIDAAESEEEEPEVREDNGADWFGG